MTITFTWLNSIIILILFFIFLIIFRWFIIIKTMVYYTSDLIDNCPDRYGELEISLIEELLKEFIEDEDSKTLDVDTFIIVGNSSKFGELLENLAQANNLKLNLSSDIDSSITTIRFYKSVEESEDTNENINE